MFQHFSLSLFFKSYLFLAALSSLLCGLLSSCGNQGLLSSGSARASHCRGCLLQSMGSRHAGSAVVVHRLSCSAACGIFPDQESNPHPLHWQILNQWITREVLPPAFKYLFILSTAVLLWTVSAWSICLKLELHWGAMQGEGREPCAHCVGHCARRFPRLLGSHPHLARWVLLSPVFMRKGGSEIYFVTVQHNSHLLPQKRLNKDFMWKYLLFEVILCKTSYAFFFFPALKRGLHDAFSFFLCVVFSYSERVIEVQESLGNVGSASFLLLLVLEFGLGHC